MNEWTDEKLKRTSERCRNTLLMLQSFKEDCNTIEDFETKVKKMYELCVNEINLRTLNFTKTLLTPHVSEGSKGGI